MVRPSGPLRRGRFRVISCRSFQPEVVTKAGGSRFAAKQGSSSEEKYRRKGGSQSAKTEPVDVGNTVHFVRKH
jgi:hypothetical protein